MYQHGDPCINLISLMKILCEFFKVEKGAHCYSNKLNEQLEKVRMKEFIHAFSLKFHIKHGLHNKHNII